MQSMLTNSASASKLRPAKALVATVIVLGIAACGSSDQHANASSSRPQRFCRARVFHQHAGDNASFRISRRQVATSGTVYVNVVNTGTTLVGRGYELRAQRRGEMRWLSVHLPPRKHKGVVVAPTASGEIVAPGKSFGCMPVAIPSNWTHGLYRLLQRVYFASGHSAGSKLLSLKFRVR